MTPAWQDEQQLCAETDPQLFFPVKGQSVTAALHVCAVCPVQEACREHAITQNILEGVWGGTTPNERKRIRKERRAS